MKFKLDRKIIFTNKKETIEIKPDDNGIFETSNKNVIELLNKKGIKEFKKKEVKANE